jgi:hypothetical protein
MARGTEIFPMVSDRRGRHSNSHDHRGEWLSAVSGLGECLAHPRSPCTCQALTDLNQPGYRERDPAVPPIPSAFPSSGDRAWPGSAASAGTVGRAAACGTAPRDARTSDARWAGRVHRYLRDVQRCQALRASRYSFAQAPAVIVFEEDSVSPDKSKIHCFHRYQYKWS